MAWCKASSLTAAVAMTFRGKRFPQTKSQILKESKGKSVEGWEIGFFLEKALVKPRYNDLRAVMGELEDWLSAQG